MQPSTQPAQPVPAPAMLRSVWPIFRAVASTVVPEATGLDEPQWAELDGLVSEVFAMRPERQRLQLRLFLRLLQWLPILRYGRRFTSLDRRHRQRFLAYLQDHQLSLIRTGFWGLRTLALLGYYGRPEAAQTIGYAPDARGWDARR